jgi:hypothetical protein
MVVLLTKHLLDQRAWLASEAPDMVECPKKGTSKAEEQFVNQSSFVAVAAFV